MQTTGKVIVSANASNFKYSYTYMPSLYIAHVCALNFALLIAFVYISDIFSPKINGKDTSESDLALLDFKRAVYTAKSVLV